MKIAEYVTWEPDRHRRSVFVTDTRTGETDHCTRDTLDVLESVAADGTLNGAIVTIARRARKTRGLNEALAAERARDGQAATVAERRRDLARWIAEDLAADLISCEILLPGPDGARSTTAQGT
jgi:hypothetical protein